MSIKLVKPSLGFESEFLSMAEEYRAASDDRYKSASEDFASFIHSIENFSKGIDLPPGYVTTSTFWLVDANHIIGRSSLRHRLTPELEIEGGNIGYDIRPSERRKGYGTLILKLMLEKARDLGLIRVLVTCDDDNVASARIIMRNGGRFEGHGMSKKTGTVVARYWIDL